MIKHYEVKHEGIKRHKCEICNTFFTEKSNLNRHMKRFHPQSLADPSKIDEASTDNDDDVSDSNDNDKACGTESPLVCPVASPPPIVGIEAQQQSNVNVVSAPKVAAVSGVIHGNKMLLTIMLPS